MNKRTIQITLNKVCPNLYNKVWFLYKTHYMCNINNPRTFNEKIQWRKKSQHDSRFPPLVDKWEVRAYVKAKCPDILVDSYGVYEKIEDIDFSSLPNSFIIKPTHGFGRVIICSDKKTFDEETAKKTMKNWLSYNQYALTGEWQYKDLKPRIIIDKLLGENIKDYKFFCFNGSPYVIQIDSDRYINHKRQLRDINWCRIPCTYNYPNDLCDIEKPTKLTEMIDICKKLSYGFDFVRVDLFLVDNKIYFSEMTFTPGNGVERFNPRKYDFEFGKLWNINM